MSATSLTVNSPGRNSRRKPPPPLRRLLQAATLASDAQLVHVEAEGRWHIQGDPTEGALVVAAAKAGLSKADLDARFPRVDEIPFTSETKRMTTLHADPAGVVAFCKGAPEVVVSVLWAAVDGRWRNAAGQSRPRADPGHRPVPGRRGFARAGRGPTHGRRPAKTPNAT